MSEIMSDDVISSRQALKDQAAPHVFNSALRPLAIEADTRLGRVPLGSREERCAGSAETLMMLACGGLGGWHCRFWRSPDL